MHLLGKSHALRSNRHVRGIRARPPAAWIKLIEKDLASVNIELNIDANHAEKIVHVLENPAADRIDWRRIVKDIMAENC